MPEGNMEAAGFHMPKKCNCQNPSKNCGNMWIVYNGTCGSCPTCGSA